MEPKELKEFLEKIGAGVATLTEEQKDLITELGDYKSRVTKLEEHNKTRNVDLPGVELEKEKFSFARAICAIASGEWKGAEFEKSVFDEARKQRDLNTGTDSAGGFIVPPQVMTEIIDLLRSRTIARELGATVMTGLVGSPVEIPKQTGGAIGFWVGENAGIPESEQTFGQATMVPHEAAALTKLSNRLLRLSNPAAEQIVRNDIALQLARLIDLAVLRGSGADNEPLGIVNTPGIGSVSAGNPNGGPATIELLYDLWLQIQNANADGDRMGWAFNPNIWNVLRKIRSDSGAGAGTGQFLIQPDPTSNDMLRKGTLLGFPFRTTTQLPSNLVEGGSNTLGEIILGNWEDLVIGEWGGMEIRASQETSVAFERNQTWVRIIQETDVLVRHPESFAVSSDVETTS